MIFLRIASERKSAVHHCLMARPTLQINSYFPVLFAGREPLLSSSALRQRQEMRHGWERDDWKDVSGISKRRNIKGCKCRKSLNHLPVAPPIIKASIWGCWCTTEARSAGDESPLARLETRGGATGSVLKRKNTSSSQQVNVYSEQFQRFVYTPWMKPVLSRKCIQPIRRAPWPGSSLHSGQ